MKACAIFLCAIILCGCGHDVYRYTEGKIYGTYYRVVYESPRVWDKELKDCMEEVNVSLSMFNPESVVSRLNRNETRQVDSLFVRLFRMAQYVNRETDGAFDITVAPLINAWGFGYKQGVMPDSGRIDTLLQWVGMEKLELRGDTLVKMVKETEIDASSIAKGLGVDRVAEFLEKQGVKNYMVDIGGEIRVKGMSGKGRPWRIGIDRPEDDPQVLNRQLQLIISLQNGALATSGNYRNFYVKEGKKYAHTVNPRTGYLVQRDIVSSTVYASTCMEADAYATAFMVLGLEESREIIAAHPELEACFIYTDGQNLKIWMTDRFKTFVLE
ncbi:FAD:protein FMN transferase [Odoribacter lunatus]|uniref:FAD:protein FMN transferase n=1 Tax=Odoribacter lunatus TaxID=2941335 RepID=UPI00204185CC|nr:FAD:protein FMN transferase [Odoribacter lunatus]